MSEPEMRVAEFMTVRGGMGNDAFADQITKGPHDPPT